MRTSNIQWSSAILGSFAILALLPSCDPDELPDPYTGVPKLTTSPAAEIYDTTAVLGGGITANGGETITAHGVVYWPEVQFPGEFFFPGDELDTTTMSPGEIMLGTVGGDVGIDTFGNEMHLVNLNGDILLGTVGGDVGMPTGDFSFNISGLAPNVSYRFRSFATNSFGTGYGPETGFTTASGLVGGELSTPGAGMTDAEGNSYATIILDGREWMAENLRGAVYANGDTIHFMNVSEFDGSMTLWDNQTAPAHCVYDNNGQYQDPYGRLYNWYAVADPRNVCPDGWHVSTEADWVHLESYLGMTPSDAEFMGWRGDPVGGLLKETGLTHWDSPNTQATNASGFTALAGGQCSGGFKGLARVMNHGRGDVSRTMFLMSSGLSVRCVKD